MDSRISPQNDDIQTVHLYSDYRKNCDICQANQVKRGPETENISELLHLYPKKHESVKLGHII
jgi:hypothetical protein